MQTTVQSKSAGDLLAIGVGLIQQDTAEQPVQELKVSGS